MLCPNGKAENQEDSIFCKNCGNRIEEIRKEDVLNSHSEAASELQQVKEEEKKCPDCSTVVEENSMFCPACGCKLSENPYSVESSFMETEERDPFWKNKRKRNILLISVASVMLITAVIYAGFHFAYITCRMAISANDNGRIEQIYQENRHNKSFMKKMEYFATKQVDKIYKNYKKENYSYDTAIEKLSCYENFVNITGYEQDLKTISDSRLAFQQGNKYKSEQDILNAAIEYRQVDPLDDKNYQIASDFISENAEKIKKLALEELDSMQSAGTFNLGEVFIDRVANLLKEDDEFVHRAYQFMAEKAKSEQKVKVAGTKILNQQYWGYDLLSVSFQNVSDKTVNYMEVLILGFDKDKKPVKIKSEFNKEGKYELWGKSDQQIKSGATTGGDSGWMAYNAGEIVYLYACPYQVTFSDGEVWENPYADYFYETYAGKDLKE